MKNKDTATEQAAELRLRAEAALRDKAGQSLKNLEPLSPEATRQMLHALQVHQIELEMQNEELRRAQVELDAERTRYFDFYNLAPVGYLTVSETGLILEANLTLSTLLGVARGTLLKQPLSRFILKVDQYIYYRHRKLLFETGEPQMCELRMVKMEGAPFWAHLAATAAQDATGAPVCRALLSDITERKHAELALRASEEKFAKAFRDAPVMITLTELDSGTFLEVNDSFARTSGFTAEEAIGRTSLALGCITPEQQARINERLATHGRIAGVELALTAKGGQRIDCLYGGEIIEIEGRKRLLAIALDTTERKRLELQIRQAQKMEAVGQLAGGVAHDFNNILAAITLHLGLLREAPDLDPETKGTLLELEKEAVRGAGLTRQLLAFSRQQAMQVKALHLNELLENLLTMLRRLLSKRIAVEWQGQPGLPAVEGDVGMLEQVVVNLCVNARDAMPGGGCLRLSTDLVTVDENAAKTIPYTRSGRYVRLSVSDSGCGMDTATLSRIFEPFFTTKDAGQGTGLGLAVVHSIVKQHAGWVEVESEVGVGTTIRVLLPAKQLRVEAAAAAGAGDLLRGQNELILVVEDEESIRSALAKTLQRYGYRVQLAHNGHEAVDLWEAHRPQIDLMMTDMALPGGMSGTDLIQRFRADRPDLRVILSSGYMTSKESLSFVDVATLPKPFQMHTLLMVLRRCLDDPCPVRPGSVPQVGSERKPSDQGSSDQGS